MKRLFSDWYDPDILLPTVEKLPNEDLYKHSEHYEYMPTLTATESIAETIISLNTELLPVLYRSTLEREISSVNLISTISINTNPLVTSNRRTRKSSLLELTYRS
jgi:hypothetical protein